MKLYVAFLMLVLLVALGCGEDQGVAQSPLQPAAVPEQEVPIAVDPILASIDTAREVFANRVAVAEAILQSDLDAHIRALAESGDPVLVREAMEERDRFVLTGAAPVDPELAEEVAAYELGIAKAQSDFAETLQAAVESLTRELRIDEAMAFRDEARRFFALAAAVLPEPSVDDPVAAVSPEDAHGDIELFPGLGAGQPHSGGELDTDVGDGRVEHGLAEGAGSDPPQIVDRVAEVLSAETEVYEAVLDASRQVLLSRIDSRVASLREAGNVAGASRLADEQVLLREAGALPTDAAMQAAVRRSVVESGRALRSYARPCAQAVADYLATGQADRADEVQQHLEHLRAVQAYREAIVSARAASLPREAYRFPACGGEVTRVAVSGDGLLCCAWDRGGVMSVWSLVTGELVSRFAAPLPDVGWLHMNRDGSIISASSWSHSGVLYRQDGAVIVDLDEHRERYNMEVSEDGRFVILGGHYWVTVQEVDAFVDGSAPKHINENTSSYSVALSSDAGVAVSGGWDPEVCVYDLSTFQQSRTLSVDGQVYGLGFSHNGSHLYAATTDKKLLVWNTESFDLVQAISGLPDVPRWSSLGDSGALICANLDRGWVFDTERGRKLYEVGQEGGYHVITPNSAFVLGTEGTQLVLYRLPAHH